MMNLSMAARVLFVATCMSISNSAATRPIEIIEPIWCLSEIQKKSLLEKFQAVIKQAETVELSLLAWRKILYLASERELHITQDRFNACLKKTQLSGDTSSCDQTGVKRLEKDIQGLGELETKPLSDADKGKMSVMVEKMRAIRSEYPLCE